MATPELTHSEPLKEELQLPSHLLIANQFSEIIKILKKSTSRTFSDKDKNYSSEICEWFDSFIAFVGNKSRRIEVIAFFESFVTTAELEREEIERFIDLLNGLEDTDEVELHIVESIEPKKFRKVEMLRAIFAAFWLLHTDIIAGAKKPPTNPLINLYLTHTESNGDYPGKLYIDNDSVVYFEPDKDSPSHIFTDLREEIARERVPLTLIVTTTVPEVVEWIVSWEVEDWIWPEIPESDTAAWEPSEAVAWRLRRRQRDRGIRAEKDESRTLQKNQEWYSLELERLRALSAFLHERFEELRNHLLENIPFIGEVIDYLGLIERLKEKWYEVDTLDVNELRRDFERLVTDYTRLIASKKALNIKLQQDLATIKDQLPTASDFEQKKFQRRMSKIQWRIDTNNSDIQAYEWTLKSRELESSNLFTQAEAYRLAAVPNREQFSLAFHHSLRAEELYLAPDFVPENPVTHEWIEANTIPLFVSILGTHLDEFHGVNIRDLYELMRKIDELPEEYSDTVNLPDTENVSQKKASDFFAMLLPIIPKDYLSEIPNHRTVVTPEWIYVPKEITKKEPKIRKTRSEKRAEASTRRASAQKSRLTFIIEMQSKEEALKEYEQYWREKLRQNIRTRRAYLGDIEKIDWKIKLRRAFPNKSRGDLVELIEASRKEEWGIRAKIERWALKNDEATYKWLIDDRAQISRKLSRIK